MTDKKLLEGVTFLQLLELLNKQKVIQTQSEWQNDFEELPVLFDEKPVAENLLIKTHRWYETSVSVYKAHEDFIGVRHITNVFSESSGYEDCYHTIKFYSMETALVKTYRLTSPFLSFEEAKLIDKFKQER